MPKRYLDLNTYFRERFGHRVHKLTVDAGMTCPNRDGTLSTTGCVYCNAQGSGTGAFARGLSIRDQLEQSKIPVGRRFKARKFMAYFQPFSNTLAPVHQLRSLYDQALAVDDVVGLAVGTRPDCVPPDVLELLGEYHRSTYFWLELGLQSSHDLTLSRLQRGHDYAAFADTYHRAKSLGLNICVHIILGLPGESRDDMLATADILADLQVDGVKLHLLHVLENTPLGQLYAGGKIEMLDQNEYIELVVDVVERLPRQTLIHRLTGDGPRARLLAPLWSLKKWEVLNAIDAEFARRGSSQGDRCKRQ